MSLRFVPKGPVDNFFSIGSGNGLAQNKWQAIIWTNDGLFYWHIYASYGLNELIVFFSSISQGIMAFLKPY